MAFEPQNDLERQLMQITGIGGIEDYFVKQTRPFYHRRILGIF